MVLEYVHGFHLGRWHRYVRRTRGLFPVEPAIHIVISVLDALHYAHTLTGPDGEPLRIVHRDISPGNVLIDTEGRIKLTDFGIARMRTDKTSASDKRALKGTFSYMAPELLKMVDPGPKSDLYSCAVLLHELLTGKNEFYSKDVASTAWSVLEHVPSPVDQVRPDVPPGLVDVLKKALAKAPEDRYADALQFAQELRRVRGIAADDAARMLSEAASRDFNDPEMASSLKATDLATLDRKWREPGRKFSFRPSLRSIRIRKSDPSTLPPTRPVSEDLPQEMGRRGLRKGVAVGVGFGVVIAGAVTVFAMRGGAPAPPPGVILVEGSVSALGVSAQPAVASDPGTTVPAKAAEAPPVNAETSARAPTPAPPPNAKPAPTKSRSELLTRAFARQQPQIARCFTQHASDVTGNPEISVRFEVATDGHVTSAQVQPVALGATPLGQCISAVARTTDFGPQPDPTPFRIPITAKRGQ
jgi:serine/threonine-protein kinase